MAPKRNRKNPAPAVTISPRKTRSATTAKRVVPPPLPAKPPSKKAKLAVEKKGNAKATDKEALVAPPPAPVDASSKTIIIEACKQCNSFKTRAMKVKEDLESAVPSIAITINPEKPRRGCFEIRDTSGEVFISLLDMKRPFTPMKKLDMDKVIKDIIEKIN